MAIILLDTQTINRIAAGEVIEKPASVVKELVENSIDAKSKEVEIKIKSGGRNLISVTDDGIGINKDEIEIAFMRHATSKLQSGDNLIDIKYLGFRGEALPSIAAVSRITLSSKVAETGEAWSISYEGGYKMEELAPCPLARGTCIEVRDLFFATPNRLKFLKTERAETQHIVNIVNNVAIINHEIGFTLISDNKRLLRYYNQPSLLNRLCEVEKEFSSSALAVHEEECGTKLTGYICKPTANFGRSNLMYIFVNKRPIKDNLLTAAIRYAYHDLIPNNRYPIVVLNLDIPYDQVDVNVHPNKSEIRFQNKKLIYEIVTRGLIKALSTRIGTNVEEVRDIHKDLELKESEDEKKKDLGLKEIEDEKEKGLECQNSKHKEEKNLELQESKREKSKDLECQKNEYEKGNKYNENQNKNSLLEQSESFGSTRSNYFISSSKHTGLIDLKEQIRMIEDYPLGFARCQVYYTYIIAQTKDNLIIVDQHAAHERLIYEYMKEVVEKSIIKKQTLLIPEVINIHDQEKMEIMENYKGNLAEMGFEIDIIHNATILVKEIPAILSGANIQEMIIDIIDRLVEIEDTLPIEDKINRILSSIACHGSIRAGREMNIEEMNALLRQMEKTPYSGQCNHGRPTYIEIKLSDIEKLFKRK